MTAVSSPPPDLHQLPCALLSFAWDGTVGYANEALAEWLGTSPAELRGRPVEGLLTPASQIYLQLVLKPILSLDRRAEEVALTLRAGDGSCVQVLADFRCRRAGEAEIVDVAMLRLRRRKDLEDQLLQARRTVQQLPGLLFRLVHRPGGRWRFVHVGQGLGELVGMEPQRLLQDARALLPLVHPEDLPAVQAAFSRSREMLRLAPITLRVQPVGGHGLRWLWLHASVHRQAGDGVVVWQGVVHDVTLQQQMDERVRQMDKLQAMATLTAGVAHDFNNLLGSIMGLIDLCQLEAVAGSRQSRNLERMAAASQRAAGLVRQLLEFSRQTPPRTETTTLGTLLHRAGALLSANLPPSVSLAIEVASDPVVRVDPVQVEQVLLNLVNNAAYALRGRDGTVRLVMDATVAPPEAEPALRGRAVARLRVLDDGEGIAAEHLPRIFQPFYTTKPVGEGTGLGLAAVHGIVTSHGGSVSVESRPGRTAFTLLFPQADGDVAPAAAAP